MREATHNSESCRSWKNMALRAFDLDRRLRADRLYT